jgi:hypothetical protein
VRLFPVAQADLVESGANALGAFAPVGAGDRQRHHHIVEHAAVGEQALVLQHQAELPPAVGNRIARQASDVLLVDQHGSPRWSLDRSDQAEHGALAGAGVAGQIDEFAGVDAEARAE